MTSDRLVEMVFNLKYYESLDEAKARQVVLLSQIKELIVLIAADTEVTVPKEWIENDYKLSRAMEDNPTGNCLIKFLLVLSDRYWNVSSYIQKLEIEKQKLLQPKDETEPEDLTD